jgi:hypothetical protein
METYQGGGQGPLRTVAPQKKTGIAICEQCAYFLRIADQNSNTLKCFAGPFKLETFKKYDRQIIPISKRIMTYSAQLAPEDTYLAICMKKMDKHF